MKCSGLYLLNFTRLAWLSTPTKFVLCRIYRHISKKHTKTHYLSFTTHFRKWTSYIKVIQYTLLNIQTSFSSNFDDYGLQIVEPQYCLMKCKYCEIVKYWKPLELIKFNFKHLQMFHEPLNCHQSKSLNNPIMEWTADV